MNHTVHHNHYTPLCWGYLKCWAVSSLALDPKILQPNIFSDSKILPQLRQKQFISLLKFTSNYTNLSLGH
jgi:hypothetical protein